MLYGIERPKYLCREKKEDNVNVEKTKVTKSVKVEALTKS
jgi:hypothetical protein